MANRICYPANECRDTAGLPSSQLRSQQLLTGAPCSPERTWAENDGRPQNSYFALLARATCAALLKESRMKSINATGHHRKSVGKPNHRLYLQTHHFVPLGQATR